MAHIVAAVIEIRPCRDESDESVALAIYNRVWPWDAITMDEVRSFKQQANEYADHVAYLEEQPAGSLAVAHMPQQPAAALALLTVLPQYRGRGVGTALYGVASSWCAERALDLIDAPVPEDEPESLAFAARRGFREVERNGRMLLDLRALEVPQLDPPAGIEIVTWAERPDLTHGIYEVACEAYADVPDDRGSVMEPIDDWLAHDMQGSGDRPDATFVAIAGDDVVGYAKFSLTAAQPKTAHHDMTGVKREWRRRGVAGALKRAQIVWAKENGYEMLATQNELRNEPIRRLNERLGYRPAPGRVTVRGPLAPA